MKEENETVLERTFLSINTKEMEQKIWDYKKHIYGYYNATTEQHPQIYGPDKTRVIQIKDDNGHIIGQLFNTKDSFTIKGTLFNEIWVEMFDDKEESDTSPLIVSDISKDREEMKRLLGTNFVKK